MSPDDSRPRHVPNDAADADTDAANSPPSYASLAPPAPPAHPAPPPSTRHLPATRGPVEHQYSLFDSRAAPWATLTLYSNVASPRFLPSYFDSQTVQGAVSLALARPESIRAVSITFSGTIVATNANPLTFWELTHVLWSADMGDPRRAEPSAGPGAEQAPPARAKHTAKLVGAYMWPFALALPATCSVALRPKQPPVSLRLPPSFSEKGAAQFINYEITVRIHRGALRIDSKSVPVLPSRLLCCALRARARAPHADPHRARLGTQFGFAPRIRPPPPSLLRRLAYQENRPLVGPEGDPDGWEVLSPIPVHGKVFGVRAIEAICTFAFASPLTYTRGSPIPCSLTVACADAQALDLVFTPAATSVHLIREVLYEADKGAAASAPPESSLNDISLTVAGTLSFSPRALLLPPLSRSPTAASGSTAASSSALPSAGGAGAAGAAPKTAKRQKSGVAPKLALRGARTAVASAVWWPRREAPAEAGRRRMEGEIALPKDLVPSFAFGGFSVAYSLALLPFCAAGFEPSSGERDAVLLADVAVGTLPPLAPAPAPGSGSGPAGSAAPRSYAPPAALEQGAAHQERLRKPIVWGLYNSYAGSRD
ncbi:hypothetical protein DFH11DRAFT_1723916 [Phellopilus nigrolimitatus]|nr:hypothetical protein DFH11DRAFT_1723916 [Phellopilus nigrolimitatus]